MIWEVRESTILSEVYCCYLDKMIRATEERASKTE